MLAFLCTLCITFAFVHFRRSVVPFMWQAVILEKKTLLDMFPCFFAVSVLMKFVKFTKDQNQTNKRKLRVFPVPQCHVAEQKECQGFNVPRLYHSALSLNAAVLIVLTVCWREPTAPLHCPSHRFGFLVTLGWIWAGSSVLRPRDAGTDTPVVFSGSALLSFLLIWIMVFSLAPALTLPFWGLFLH